MSVFSTGIGTDLTVQDTCVKILFVFINLETCAGCDYANADTQSIGKGIQSRDICSQKGHKHRQEHPPQSKQVSKISLIAALEQ